MTDLTHRPPGPPAPNDFPNFQKLEPVIDIVQSARQASVMQQAATPALLAQLDTAIASIAECKVMLSSAVTTASLDQAGVYLALLMKAYGNSGLQDAKVYGRLLLEDVLSVEPCGAAVDIACRRWRRSSKFLPAISELLVEIRNWDASVRAVGDFAQRLPDLRERVARELGI